MISPQRGEIQKRAVVVSKRGADLIWNHVTVTSEVQCVSDINRWKFVMCVKDIWRGVPKTSALRAAIFEISGKTLREVPEHPLGPARVKEKNRGHSLSLALRGRVLTCPPMCRYTPCIRLLPVAELSWANAINTERPPRLRVQSTLHGVAPVHDIPRYFGLCPDVFFI